MCIGTYFIQQGRMIMQGVLYLELVVYKVNSLVLYSTPLISILEQLNRVVQIQGQCYTCSTVYNDTARLVCYTYLGLVYSLVKVISNNYTLNRIDK